MTDQNKETVWITIPNEATPALEAPVNVINRGSYDRVNNRGYWGVGFVALMAFVALLLAPQQIVGLMQAQLFDGTFQVVPDYEEQESGTLFGDGDGEDGEGETVEESGDQNVVEAESEAVSIQIDPVTDVEDGSTSGDAGSEAEDAVITDAGTGTDNGTDGAEVVTEAETIAVDDSIGLDANAKLLQSLSKQLEDFKDKESQNEQLIQDLMQLIGDQAAGIHGSAGATLTSGQTSQLSTQVTGQIGSVTGVGAGVYRYNTHTVSVSPYEILAQNKAATQQASYQANVTYGAVQAYSNQSYNPVLAGVQGQPDTGPTEAVLFAFALASLGVLVWGSMRAIRV